MAPAQDPLVFRLQLLEHDPRAQAVIRAAAEMAGWDGPQREGRAFGLAYSSAWGAHCAQVAEVSLDRGTGQLTVHRICCAVDCGLVVQPRKVDA